MQSDARSEALRRKESNDDLFKKLNGSDSASDKVLFRLIADKVALPLSAILGERRGVLRANLSMQNYRFRSVRNLPGIPAGLPGVLTMPRHPGSTLSFTRASPGLLSLPTQTPSNYNSDKLVLIVHDFET